MNIRQAAGIQKKVIFQSGLCSRAVSCLVSRQPQMEARKRKLDCHWMTVGQTQKINNSCAENVNGTGFVTFTLPQTHGFCGNVYDRGYFLKSYFDAFQSVCDYVLHKRDKMKSSSDKCHNNKKVIGLSASKPQYHHQNSRHFARKTRHIDRDDEDPDDEEKKRRLRGAVMYVSNPMTWVSKRWNIAKLRHKLDPSFSENEFLLGATQAVTYVSQMVSSGKFDQLSGLVIDEVIDWLMNFRNSLAAVEREALSLSAEDVVLMKIRYVHLDSDQDKALAFVDSVCFGLRLCDRVPYLADLGLRFKRDYSTDPPGDWIVAGVSHIRLQNLATD